MKTSNTSARIPALLAGLPMSHQYYVCTFLDGTKSKALAEDLDHAAPLFDAAARRRGTLADLSTMREAR